ncbi:MAG: hypothetical protein JSV91_12755 [Phycisphaerales bacterium]|nr:MAG: hypothetical protein JSV91_12755 [Phycisphaerales bacterium]
MKPRSVAVELLSDRIDVVAYHRGESAAVRRLPITLDTDPGEWIKAVRHAGALLQTAVKQLGIRGLPTHVLYRSPTQVTDLTSFQVRSASQAIEAAHLSCIDSLPYSAMSAACEAAVVGRDSCSRERQTHTVVTAERDDVATAISQMIEEAGLQFVSATPMDAAIFAATVSGAMARRGELRGRLYLGEHSSMFLVVGEGKLHFGRRIGLGLMSLAGSLTRPIRRDANAEPIELDLPTARNILHEYGIPGGDAVVHQELGLTARDLIPLMQPVLQRFIVELRQSIRFGLPEEKREGLVIFLTGPGCHLKGVSELIGEELGAEVTSDADRAVYDWARPGSPGGELSDAMADRGMLKRLNLQPHALAVRQRAYRLRRWLWTGAAAALAVVAFDAMRYHLRLNDAYHVADALAVHGADIDALFATSERLRGVIDAINELDRFVARETSPGVDFPACMKELSRLTQSSIRFTAIAFHEGNDGIRGSITGYAFPTKAGSGQTRLEEFISALHLSPLFDDVVLGAVQMGEYGQATGQRFEVGFRGVSSPRPGPQDLAAAADEEAAR